MAQSSAEAELVAAMDGAALVRGISPLVAELVGQEVKTWSLVDNTACVAIVTSPSTSWRTRHLKIRAAGYVDLVERGVLHLRHVPGATLVADALTKPLATQRLRELMERYGVSWPSSSWSKPKVARCTTSSFLSGPTGTLRLERGLQLLVVSSVLMVVAAEDHPEAGGRASLGVWVAIFVVAIVIVWEFLKKFAQASVKKMNTVVAEENRTGSSMSTAEWEVVTDPGRGEESHCRPRVRRSLFDEQYEPVAPTPTWSSSWADAHIAARGGTDKWTMEPTVLIRWHNRGRRHLYLPNGPGWPVGFDTARLAGERRTFAHFDSGDAHVVNDVIFCPRPKAELQGKWRGRTEFRLLPVGERRSG